MDDFNAESARKISAGIKNKQLLRVLSEIKTEAHKGLDLLHIKYQLNDITIELLKQKGFDVINEPSLATQRDGLYHRITW